MLDHSFTATIVLPDEHGDKICDLIKDILACQVTSRSYSSGVNASGRGEQVLTCVFFYDNVPSRDSDLECVSNWLDRMWEVRIVLSWSCKEN